MTTASKALRQLEPISPRQRKALFAAGKARGLDLDALRSLTPAGEISALTFDQAAALLSRLNDGSRFAHPRHAPRGPRRPKGVYAIAAAAQLRRVEACRIDLGWTPERLAQWLGERHFADRRTMSKIDSTTDAQSVIELLKAVVLRQVAARSRGTGDVPRGVLPADGAAADPIQDGHGAPVACRGSPFESIHAPDGLAETPSPAATRRASPGPAQT